MGRLASRPARRWHILRRWDQAKNRLRTSRAAAMHERIRECIRVALVHHSAEPVCHRTRPVCPMTKTSSLQLRVLLSERGRRPEGRCSQSRVDVASRRTRHTRVGWGARSQRLEARGRGQQSASPSCHCGWASTGPRCRGSTGRIGDVRGDRTRRAMRLRLAKMRSDGSNWLPELVVPRLGNMRASPKLHVGSWSNPSRSDWTASFRGCDQRSRRSARSRTTSAHTGMWRCRPWGRGLSRRNRRSRGS